MLCFEGSAPVMKDDQATGEMAGVVVRQPGVGPFLLQPGQIGQLPFGHELLGQGGLEAVQTEDDDAVDVALFEGPLAADGLPEETEGPGEEREEGQEEGQEEDEEGGQESESGAGADIGGEGSGARTRRTAAVRSAPLLFIRNS